MTGTASEPWPIANAVACLKEVRDREAGDDERAEAVRLSMEYAIEVVKGINSMREPQPPDPAEEARRAVRQFCGDLAMAFENLARGFEMIANGEIPDRED
jgi:hypothetical protein